MERWHFTSYFWRPPPQATSSVPPLLTRPSVICSALLWKVSETLLNWKYSGFVFIRDWRVFIYFSLESLIQRENMFPFFIFYFNGCVQVSWVQAMAQFQIFLNLHKAPSVLKQSWPGIRSMYVINYSFGKCQRVRPSAEGSSPDWLIEPSAVGLFNNALNMYYSAAQSSRSHSISTHSFSNGHLGTPLPLLPFHS